jgi:hypothetical protein
MKKTALHFSTPIFYVTFFATKKIKNATLKKAGKPLLPMLYSLVPGAGIEPARPQRPQDFKSCVSTSSTTWAFF